MSRTPRPDADPADLDRFVTAQDDGGTYRRALAELRAGRKSTHWMWFVFPQIAGLGRSETARYFALRSVDEAHAYLENPVLGPRLRESANAALAAPAPSVEVLLGSVDAQKLRSSMTLFARAAPAEALWAQVLDRWFGGRFDEATDALIGRSSPER